MRALPSGDQIPMLFAVMCKDAAGAEVARNRCLDEHKNYLKSQAHVLVLGGALTDRDDRPNGSLYIVNVDDVAAARKFSNDDPFVRHGVFSDVVISSMRKTHWHPESAD
jgi:uncharacterized protein YciI